MGMPAWMRVWTAAHGGGRCRQAPRLSPDEPAPHLGVLLRVQRHAVGGRRPLLSRPQRHHQLLVLRRQARRHRCRRRAGRLGHLVLLGGRLLGPGQLALQVVAPAGGQSSAAGQPFRAQLKDRKRTQCTAPCRMRAGSTIPAPARTGAAAPLQSAAPPAPRPPPARWRAAGAAGPAGRKKASGAGKQGVPPGLLTSSHSPPRMHAGAGAQQDPAGARSSPPAPPAAPSPPPAPPCPAGSAARRRPRCARRPGPCTVKRSRCPRQHRARRLGA